MTVRTLKVGGIVNSGRNIKAIGSLIKVRGSLNDVKPVGRMIKANRRLIRGYKYFHNSLQIHYSILSGTTPVNDGS